MDPLRERYPACYEECARLAVEAQSRGLRLVNPPDALSNSIKSLQSRIWRAAGVPTPPHFRYEDRDELNTLLGGVAFPAIVRSDLDHSQAGMRFCRSPDDVFRINEAELPRPGTITPFIDTRGGFRVTKPESTWAKYYHKKRAHVFGNAEVPLP